MEIADSDNYEYGVIYKIVCKDNYYYYGSTTNMENRIKNHKYHSQIYTFIPLYSHINTIGWDNVKFEIIEEYPCNTKIDLLKREDEYIKKAIESKEILCLNAKRAYVSPEERKQNMKEYYRL